VCTYLTIEVPLSGSAKGGQGWFTAGSASVYFDHPVHAPYDHSLNVDVFPGRPGGGSGPAAGADGAAQGRVALELSPESAAALAHAILAALDEAARLMGHKSAPTVASE
jgi:hypothetical protein